MLYELCLLHRVRAAALRQAVHGAAVCGCILLLPTVGTEAEISMQIKTAPLGRCHLLTLSLTRQEVGYERRDKLYGDIPPLLDGRKFIKAIAQKIKK